MGIWMFSQTRPHPSRSGSWDRITRYVSMWRSQWCRSVSPFLSCFPFRNICPLNAWKYTTWLLAMKHFYENAKNLSSGSLWQLTLDCQIGWIYNQPNKNQLGMSVRDCLDQFNWNLKDHPKGDRQGKRKYKREKLWFCLLSSYCTGKLIYLVGIWMLALLLLLLLTLLHFSLTLEPSFIGPPR